MSLFKKKIPTLEEQISRLSPKCRELTDEESRLVNGGGPSVWDTYNGTGCPYEYTTVPKDPPAETTTPASNTPANKTTEIAETTATDTTNQTPEQETGNATSSPTSISTPVSQTPIADYVRKVVNTAFELQKKNFGKEYIEMDYQGQHILVARAGNAKSIEQAAQYYFTTGKDGVIGNKVVDAIAVADENGNIIHKFSNDDAIRAYEKILNNKKGTVYFIYTYSAEWSENQSYQICERPTINDDIYFLMNSGCKVKVYDGYYGRPAGTKENIKKALEDSDSIGIIFSGHGHEWGGISTSDGKSIYPSEINSYNISDNLDLIIFENCYQKGSEKGIDDNIRKWKNVFSPGVNIVGWEDTLSVFETIMFNDLVFFDRQDKNLRGYLKTLINDCDKKNAY